MPSSANGYCTASAPSARGLSDSGYLAAGTVRSSSLATRTAALAAVAAEQPGEQRDGAAALVSSPYQLTRRPGWITVAGRWLENSTAAARMRSAETPVSWAAHSTV